MTYPIYIIYFHRCVFVLFTQVMLLMISYIIISSFDIKCDSRYET